MLFTWINGNQYIIPIDLQNLNDYNSFNNYVSEYLYNIDSNIKKKLDDTIINSENYSNFINTNEWTLGIVFQKLPQINSTNTSFTAPINNDFITWGESDNVGDSNNVIFVKTFIFF